VVIDIWIILAKTNIPIHNRQECLLTTHHGHSIDQQDMTSIGKLRILFEFDADQFIIPIMLYNYFIKL